MWHRILINCSKAFSVWKPTSAFNANSLCWIWAVPHSRQEKLDWSKCVWMHPIKRKWNRTSSNVVVFAGVLYRINQCAGKYQGVESKEINHSRSQWEESWWGSTVSCNVEMCCTGLKLSTTLKSQVMNYFCWSPKSCSNTRDTSAGVRMIHDKH